MKRLGSKRLGPVHSSLRQNSRDTHPEGIARETGVGIPIDISKLGEYGCEHE